MKSSSTSTSRSNASLKSKYKATAGTVVALPTPPRTLKSSSHSRSESVSSIDTSKADFLPCSETSSRSQYDLYNRYPSLTRCVTPIRKLRGSIDVSSARSLARVLLSGVADVIHVIEVAEHIKNDQQFQENVQAVSFMIQELKKQIERLEDVEESRSKAAVVRTVDIVELTLAALERFLNLTERLVKPLPSLPVDTSRRSKRATQGPDPSSARKSLAQITSEVLKETPDESSSSVAPDTASTSSASTSRTATILAILHKARENGLGSLFRSNSDIIREVSILEKDADDAEALPQYAPRHSALYYPVDPLNPNVDIQLPPMSEDSMNIVMSHDSTHIIKSSPTAIIRLLTSKDAIQDPTLIHWFFTSFRYVLLPSEVLDLLIRRFNESMPYEPMTHQQIRVWCNNQHRIVRPRVISVLIRWITQYWNPPYDDVCVLNDMQDFVLKQVAASLLPEKLGIAFAQAIKGVRIDGLTRTKWLQNRFKSSSNLHLASTPFAFDSGSGNKFPLASFDSPAGHKALANQLTSLEIELFEHLPTQALIRSWLKDKTKPCEERMRKNLSEIKKRHKALGKDLTRLLQQADGSSNRVLVETLMSQQVDLLKESDRLASKIHAYQVTEREIARSKLAAEHAATAVKTFDRSLSMFVLHTIILDSKNLDGIAQAINFWLNVCIACLEMNNMNCAWTIYWASTYSTVVGRLFDILPSWEGSETQKMYNKLTALFNHDLKKVDELPESVASIPRFQYLSRNVTHIAETSSDLMTDNNIHTNNLRVLGKTISAIEASRLYVLPEDGAVQCLLRNHVAKFNVINETAHMQWFTKRSEELKPPKARRTATNGSATASLKSVPSLSPPPSPKSEVGEILFIAAETIPPITPSPLLQS
ncbi:hypothetical protein GYMLUDRAFT_374210 [Collybiopsis luxurians FD-317 M1]|uniref:N-terminal Ras-GEF domain-containing protein n=1 Tax=Collybiopsis luxurians FD-317 M1 TaxID=944289 RepID=A0A0D0BCE3_9AGAR|nr:hypothetical protein GYMLUDRAFT_374210 [Collybiopsis luxurians FD-317 M1]